ncbi:MAG: hypothetical protein AAGI90_00960 [Chlamydiota bacterium]
MRLLIKLLLSFILIVLIVLGIAWVFRAKIVAHYISKSLNDAKVTVQHFHYEDASFKIEDLEIFNIDDERTTAFSAEMIEIDASWKDLTKTPLVIEAIELSNLSIQIEVSSNGTTNWDRLLKEQNKSRKKKPSKAYLIQELTLRNLFVTVTTANGKVTQYPMIDELVLYNISNETGFPLREVEKAIFQIVLRKLFEDFGIRIIDNILKGIVPDPSNLPFLGR